MNTNDNEFIKMPTETSFMSQTGDHPRT